MRGVTFECPRSMVRPRGEKEGRREGSDHGGAMRRGGGHGAWPRPACGARQRPETGTTPFKVVYGRDPPALLSHEKGRSRVPAVEQQLLEHAEFLLEIKERLFTPR
jgi:hypothetical protein